MQELLIERLQLFDPSPVLIGALEHSIIGQFFIIIFATAYAV